jgi:methylphosphotriester-DNA--protein-cysteine methyltransferase
MQEHDSAVDSGRWVAVQRRDPVADGSFVYAVRTTKIYCRPVCKARLARRANVSFYGDAQDAEKAGYRACKRCRPEVAGPMPEERAVLRVRALIDREMAQPIQTAEKEVEKKEGAKGHTRGLARRARVSKWYFHRTFKEITGLTPAEYRRCQGLAHSESPVSETADCDGVTGLRDADTSDNTLHNHLGGDIDWASLLRFDRLDELGDSCSFDEVPYDSAMHGFNIWTNQLDLSIDHQCWALGYDYKDS